MSYLTGSFLGATMLSFGFARESDFPFGDVLSALPAEVVAWRAQRRMLLAFGAAGYLGAAFLVLSFLS
ncbi:hypothetical protein [Roseovarius sp. CAU 1744]|uniref:hypothetical protein n=1 Tax=Roseovarius sp. CAU 1744 TaxID=3140368 RepID=UPI00325A8E12